MASHLALIVRCCESHSEFASSDQRRLKRNPRQGGACQHFRTLMTHFKQSSLFAGFKEVSCCSKVKARPRFVFLRYLAHALE